MSIIGLIYPVLTLILLNTVYSVDLSGMYLVQFILLFPAVLWASQFKTQHLKETLGFRKFSLKSLGKWLLLLAGFFFVEGLVGSIFDIDAGVFLKSMSGSKNMFLIFTLYGASKSMTWHFTAMTVA